jgi:hypothetical protein
VLAPSFPPLDASLRLFTANATAATTAVQAWVGFGLDGRKAALQRAVDALQRVHGGDQERAGLDHLLDFVAIILQLPDPSHALETAAISAKRAAGR